MSILGRVRFAVGYQFPRWVLFRKICLKYSPAYDCHCCLTKGHEGRCHGDVGFEERYRKAVLFFDSAKKRLNFE